MTHKGDLADVCACVNDHVLCFFIHKFTDGKEGGGLYMRRQGNNVGYDSFSRAAKTIQKKKNPGSMALSLLFFCSSEYTE